MLIQPYQNPSKDFCRHRQTYYTIYVEKQSPRIAKTVLKLKNEVGVYPLKGIHRWLIAYKKMFHTISHQGNANLNHNEILSYIRKNG